MYKLLIADDSKELRNGLKCIIDWQKAGYSVCGEASDGWEAIELLKKEEFHVLLTDIQMPKMDGIELIKKCSEAFPSLEIIIISGYDDFAYAKTAIQFGVMDYLLKPVIRGELRKVLDKIRLKLEAQNKEKSESSLMKWKLNQSISLLREQFMLQLVNDNLNGSVSVQDRAAQLQLGHILNEQYKVQFICVEMRIPPGRLEEKHPRLDMMRLAFQMMCRDVAQMHEENVLTFHDFNFINMMHFIVRIEENNDSLIQLVAQDIITNINNYLRIDAKLGIGRPCVPFVDFKTGYVSSLFSWSRGFTDEGKAHDIHMETASPNATGAAMLDMEKSLTLTLEREDYAGFVEHFHTIFSNMKVVNLMEDSILIMRVILLLNSVCRKYNSKATEIQDYTWICYYTVWKFESQEKVFDQIYRLAQYVIHIIKDSKKSGTTAIVDAVRDYIDSNYAFELSLSYLAEDFHLNETYLSKIFKKQIGKTFSDYILDVRMSQAVNLLKQSDLKLDEIAELVGISNASYFSNVFKKHFGCSPNAYRLKMNPYIKR